jgi:hydrogenase nickel incorporation protein HypA/HybF
MHELALVEQIVAIAERHANGGKVTKVTLERGKLSCALPEALRFCFGLATEGTAIEGAALEIVEVPGRGRCNACGGEVEMHQPLSRCACGGSELEWLSGEQLDVRSMEVT